MRLAGAVLILCLVAAVARAQVAPQTVTKAGTAAPNAVGVQGVAGGIPIPVDATVTIGAITATNPSVGTVGATAPTSTTQIGGVDSGGVLRVPYVMTSTPSGSEPGLVVRMPSGAAGLTNTELRAAPVAVGASQSGTWSGVGVTGPLTNTELRAAPVSTSSTIIGTVPVSGTFWQATQPVSGTVAATLTGQSVTSTISGTVTVTGSLTDTQLRASAVPVSLTGQSVTSTLAAGSAVTSTISGITNGQKAMASSFPVVIASDQSRMLVSASTTLIGPLGQTTMAASIPVTMASNQSAISVTSTSSQLPASLGQKAMAAAFPVVIASDQSSITSTISGTVTVGTHAVTLSGQSVTSTGLAQGSATSGATGFLMMGTATSTPPTRTGDTNNPLSLTLAGGLRTTGSDLSEYTTSATSTTATALFQIVALSGSLKTYILNWKCSASGASTTTTDQQCLLKYGTGTACATGTTLLDGCFNPATGGCNGGQIVVPAGQAVCGIHAAAGTKLYTVTWKQGL